MDEKFLEEIRRQEELLSEDVSTEHASATEPVSLEEIPEPSVVAPNGQRTLFGGDA